MLQCPSNTVDAIEKMRSAGLNPTLDHIALLIELGRRVQNPPHRTQGYLEGVGVRAGTRGPRLLPLSIEGGLWFDWATSALSGDNEKTYALALACDPTRAGTLSDLYELSRARHAVNEYAKALACSPDELESALIRIMDESTPGDELRAERESNLDFDMADTVAHMVSVTGLPSEYWYTKPLNHGMRVLTHAMEMRVSIMGSSGDSVDHEYQRACFDFAAGVQKVEAECNEALELENHG